ncbi:MAG TPA: serine hydrolase domain-containing protein [Solirubrobacteraceae bacterium]|nr:serine hydrolase domain-containing protein [Solirubrobacteraceae bacterium]
MAVDLKKLMTGIKDQLDGNFVGYAVAIYQSGTLKLSTSGGWAVIGEKKFDSNVRFSMGSMGKTISAAAIVRALRERGKSIDDPIHQELVGWEMGPNAKKVTYRMVLTHTTGLLQNGTTQNALKARFAKGLPEFSELKLPVPKVPASHRYANDNFDLTRFLLPLLTLPTVSRAAMIARGASDSDWGKAHIAHVKKEILKPCGLPDVDVVYTGPPPKTRYYASLVNQQSFHESNTLARAQEFVGAGWWTMSAREYAHFIDRLRAGSEVKLFGRPELAQNVALRGIWKTMRDNRAQTNPEVGLGLFRTDVPDGDAFWHNGAVPNHSSAWMALPNGISVVICRNSGGGMLPAPEIVIRTAYEQALA